MRLLILAFLAYFLYRFLRGLLRSGGYIKMDEARDRVEDKDSVKVSDSVNDMIQDPFCKTYVPLRDAKKRVIAGRKYYFCSNECADRFEMEIINSGHS